MANGAWFDLSGGGAVVTTAAEAGLEGVFGAVEATGTLDYLVRTLTKVSSFAGPLCGVGTIASITLAKVRVGTGALGDVKVFLGVGGTTGATAGDGGRGTAGGSRR